MKTYSLPPKSTLYVVLKKSYDKNCENRGGHFEFGHKKISPRMTKWHHSDYDSRHAEVPKTQIKH